MTNKMLTKEAPIGRSFVDVDFTPATDDETKRLLKDMNREELPPGYTAGWASTPDRDYYGHVVMPGAFNESIISKGFVGPKGIRLLLQHDRNRIAGVIKVLKNIGDRLWIEAQLNLDSMTVKDFYSTAKMVGGLNFSVGFYIEDYEYRSKDNEETLYILKGELEEVSVVTFPGNAEATMTFLKQEPNEEPGVYTTLAEFEKALQKQGLVASRNTAARLTQAVKKNLALFAPPAPRPAPVAKEKLNALSTLIGDLKGMF